MAVGASKPTVVADGDGFFTIKSKMLVSSVWFFMPYLHQYFKIGVCSGYGMQNAINMLSSFRKGTNSSALQ